MTTRGKPDKVPFSTGDAIADRAESLQAAYSMAVTRSYRNTGNLAPGFDAADLVAWILKHRPEVFDDKGKRRTS